MRDPIPPQAFVPMLRVDAKGVPGTPDSETFVLRTAERDPMTMADAMRRKMSELGMSFRVSNVTTEQELINDQTVRERLLASLGGFFAALALLLAAIGLYGVLHYSVVQRERELGIRIAIGASAVNITRLVTTQVFAMVLAGTVAGCLLGTASVRYVQTLLFGVKASDASMLLVPMVVLLSAALLAALPAVLRAVRIDPAVMLRAE
jgi:putative ABC transport system permease protein